MLKILSSTFVLAALFVSCKQKPQSNSVFYMNIGGEPSRLNPIGTTDAKASDIAKFIHEGLLTQDINNYDWKPSLATEWRVSADKTVFTFKLRQGVKWHDGAEFTAEDVKFSFDIIFKDTFNTVAVRPYYEGLKEVKIIDRYTVEIIAKDKNWQNFEIAATMEIYPKHFYEQDKKKSFFNKNLNGTGPYKLELYSRGNRIVLVKNENWWGDKGKDNDKAITQKEWNFPKIVLRFVSDESVSLEMLKKGAIDFLGMGADTYVKKAVGKEWGISVHKVKVENKTPKGYSWIGWNLKHKILRDRDVRKALYHLVNRDLMIEKFEHGYSVPAKGPIYPESPYADPNLKAVEFNPELALKILKEKGWKDTDGDNILDKVIDGKKTKFSITIMEPWDGFMKYLTIFKEDAKKAGVEINIKLIEWNSFVKLLDEKKFDACRLAWTASIDWNPIQIWHSDSINGGSNFISYSNKDADRLMTDAKFIHDRAERIKLLRKVEKLIVDDYPYVWFSYKATSMYGVTDRIKKNQDTYNYGIGTSFWDFKSKIREDI